MNNKLLFPDFENIIVAGEIPTAIENGYTYLEQVMALRKYVLSLGEYTKDLTTIVNNNTDDITKLKAFKHITHLGTKEGDIFKLEELKDDLYYADYNIFIQYKTGFLAYFKKGALITKSSGISENEEYNKLENVLQHQATGYIDGTITTTYNVYNSVTKEILDANTSSINISELNTKLDNHSNEISNLQTKVIELTNSITTINGILESTSHIKHISENANLWELTAGIYKATTNLNIKISSDASVTDEPITTGQIFMVQSSNNDEWEMWYTVGTNIMYAQTLKENDVYMGSRKSINVRTITSKVEDLENRVTNLEKAPKDQSIFIEFNEGTDTIIPKLQVFIDNFRKGIVTPIYWYYTSGDLLQLSKIVNGLNNPNKGMNLYFTAFDSTTLTNKQIPVGYILISVDLTTYNITNINKNWEYQTIGGSETSVPAIDLTLTSSELTEEFKTKIKEMTTKFNSNEPFTSKFTQYTTDPFTASGRLLPCTYILETIYNSTNTNTIYFNYRMALAYTPSGSSDSLVRQDIIRVSYNYNTNIINLTKYNTSYPTDYTKIITPATSTTLGGVKIGNGIDVTPDGTINNEINTYIIDMNDRPIVVNEENKVKIDNIINDYENKRPFIAYLYRQGNSKYNDTWELINVYKPNNTTYKIQFKDTIFNNTDNLNEFYVLITKEGNEYSVSEEYIYTTPNPAGYQNLFISSSDTTDDIKTKLQNLNKGNYISGVLDEDMIMYNFIKIEEDMENMSKSYYFEKDEIVNGKLKLTTIIYTLEEMENTLTKQTIVSYLPNEEITNTKKFSFNFLFSDDAIDSVSSYNTSSFIISGITKAFDVNEIYGELMVKYSEVIDSTTYSSVCPADRLKYMLTNVSDVDYSFRALTDGTSQLTLNIKRTDETQAFTSPTNMKIENIFINGYLLNSTEDISKSTTITKN